MRAQTINFEKGLDPKNSLGIGQKAVLKKKYGDELGEVVYLLDPYLKKYGFDLGDEDLEYPVKMEYHNHEGDYIDIYEFGRNSNPGYRIDFSIKESMDIFYEKGKTRFEDVDKLLNDEIWEKLLEKIPISENLEFERGQDPKTSMGIGKEATYRKISRMMKADGWTPIDPGDSNSAAGWAVEYKHHDLAKFIIDHDMPSNLGDDLIYWAAGNKDLKMVELILSYRPKIHNPGFLLRQSSNTEEIYNMIKNYLNSLNESIDFERRQNPKRAMGLGKKKFKDKYEVGFFILDHLNELTDGTYPNYKWKSSHGDTAEFYNANYEIIDDLIYGYWPSLKEFNLTWWDDDHADQLLSLSQGLRNAVMARVNEMK